MNLDLIYGGTQSMSSWMQSVTETVAMGPEEIYLYPLYVRELTGLSKRPGAEQDSRLEQYSNARDALLGEGYEQVSMRMFRKATRNKDQSATDYSCQADGMVGVGCGARSYTSALHYGSDYAVKQSAIAKLIQQFVQQSDVAFRVVNHGIELDDDEQRRRHVILSIFLIEGLSRSSYRHRFASDPLADFPELKQLVECELGVIETDKIVLNEKGIAASDAIGPWLYSSKVRSRMENYSWTNR